MSLCWRYLYNAWSLKPVRSACHNLGNLIDEMHNHCTISAPDGPLSGAKMAQFIISQFAHNRASFRDSHRPRLTDSRWFCETRRNYLESVPAVERASNDHCACESASKTREGV